MVITPEIFYFRGGQGAVMIRLAFYTPEGSSSELERIWTYRDIVHDGILETEPGFEITVLERVKQVAAAYHDEVVDKVVNIVKCLTMDTGSWNPIPQQKIK